MSSAELDLQELYQQDYPAPFGGWGVDSDLLTGVLVPNTEFSSPVGESASIGYGVACHPTQPPLLFASACQVPGEWYPYEEPDRHVPQTPLDTITDLQFPGMIDPNASAVTTMQDPGAWGVIPPCVPNLYPSSPPAGAVLHASFAEVAQSHQISSLPDPSLYGQHAPTAHHHHCPSSDSVGGEPYQQQQEQHNFLCAFRRANAEHPDWQRLKQERKRAGRRAVETRHRKKEREDHEKIESTSKRLQDLNASLVAEERALTSEKLSLMGQLLSHAGCNDSAIAEYLRYASQETIKKAREQHLMSARGQRSGSAPPVVGGKRAG